MRDCRERALCADRAGWARGSPAGGGSTPARTRAMLLFGVGRERLGSMLLPIGEMRKADVRRWRDWGCRSSTNRTARRSASVPDDDYAGLVERRRPGLAAGGGEIVDTGGAHARASRGAARFTIGQRRKVGVALGRPIYVVERDPVG